MSTLLAVIREHDDASEFLNWPGDFDLDRSDHVEDVHLARRDRAAVALGLELPAESEGTRYEPLFEQVFAAGFAANRSAR